MACWGSGRSPLGLAALLLVTQPACEELPDLAVSRCGDGFIDPDTEDCDGPSLTIRGEAYVCGPSCRLTCDPAATECAIDPTAPGCCPPGWGCSRERVCSRATGELTPIGTPIDSAALRVAAADFDGDGQAEIATFGDEVKLHFFTEGALSGTYVAPSSSEGAVIGELTGDVRADIAIPGLFGLSVLRGQSDGRLEATPYSLKLNVGKANRFIVLDARPTEEALVLPRWSGDEILVFGGRRLGGSLRSVEDGKVLFDSPIMPESLAPRIAIGQIVDGPDSPCEEFVLGATGSRRVNIYSPCETSDGQHFDWRTQPLKQSIELPDPWRVTEGSMLAHLSSGKLDLLVYASDGKNERLLRAARTSNDDDPLYGPPQVFEVPLGAMNTPYQGRVLATGDLNLDGIDDFVAPDEVFLSHDGGPYTRHALPIDLMPGGREMIAATIADMNADGRLDVIASISDKDPAFINDHIEILNNVGGGIFNRLAIPTSGAASNLTVGDFDGDLIADVAYGEATDNAGQTSDPTALKAQVTVIFGRADAAPDPPTHIGRFSGVETILTGRDLLPLGTVGDAMSDLAVLWRSAIGGLQRQAIFPASTDRRLQSPFIFLHQNNGPFTFDEAITYTPIRVAIGKFNADPHGDLAVLTERLNDQGNFRLYRLPATAEARIDASDVTFSEIKRDALWGDALIGAVDADACGDPGAVDEVALLAPYGTGSGSNLWLARVDDKGSWTFEPVVFGLPEPMWRAMQVEDVDGDGCKDVIALSDETLAIFWNRPGFGDISRLDLLPVTSSDSASPAFVCAELENEPGRNPAWKEILLVTASETILLRPDPTSATIDKGPALDEGGISVAAGDIDHDGLVDPVILGEGSLKVFRATPRIR